MDKTEIKNKNKSVFLKSALKLFIMGLIGLFIGIIIQRNLLSSVSQTNGKSNDIAQESTSKKTTIWTCSMHPQIRQPKPGKCPICYMDLIPIEQTQTIGQRQIEFTEEAIKLMDVQTTTVDHRFVEAQVNLVGKIDYDESRVQNIAAWVPGRIDRLYVDFTGTTVRKGDHLVYLYSPELLSSQAELIEAAKALTNIKPDTSDIIRQTYLSTVESAREKLRLLGLEKEQIDKIEKSGNPTDHLTIYSPIGGIVIDKMAKAGDYVETGKTIYTVADLSRVWVKLDAYEIDLAWIRYGQKVEFTTEAYQGDIFKGTISFIDPVLNPQTRTVKLRINTDNSDMRLKPEMFVHAIVRVNPSSDGKVAQPEFAGKWICPMHPDIVKDNPGICDICGMDLVTAESLGIVTTASEELPLVIPVSAALVTGKRAVVYVKVPDANVPTFEGREVILGPRAGDYYLVKEGLKEGEIIVTKGNFKIDSALQIQAKPSMMSPPDQNMPMNHQNEEGQMKEGMNMPGM
jgi:Cu(I)/Ag(I) efflux system membrane fusion protein